MKHVQMEKQYTSINKNTGKSYKKWEFICWTILPDFSKIEHKIKGKWIIIKGSDGRLERYDMECIVD